MYWQAVVLRWTADEEAAAPAFPSGVAAAPRPKTTSQEDDRDHARARSPHNRTRPPSTRTGNQPPSMARSSPCVICWVGSLVSR